MEAITFEQLPRVVGQLVAKLDRIEQLLQAQNAPIREEPEEVLNLDRACAFLNLAKPTVYGMVSQGKIPYMKQGKKLYFIKQELAAWLKEGRRGPKDDACSTVDRALTLTRRKRG